MMAFDPTLGPALRDHDWVPSIRYLLRRARILRLLRPRQGGALIEVGCGAGALLVELASCGFHCVGLETSPEAHAKATEVVRLLGAGARVVREPQTDFRAAFDFVCAFDVLEHIEDDAQALSEWASWLKPGGRLILSVPAHQRRWGPGDVWAGHFRRYDAAQLRQLVSKQGLRIEHFECYGFPVANLTEWFGRRSYQRSLARQADIVNRAQATARSGVERSTYGRLYPLIRSLPGRLALRLCYGMQGVFARTDWGSGYIVVAQTE